MHSNLNLPTISSGVVGLHRNTMIGIIAQYKKKFAIAVAPTLEMAEQICIEIFAEQGIQVRGVEIEVAVFSTLQIGGTFVDPMAEDVDVSGWSDEGYGFTPEEK